MVNNQRSIKETQKRYKICFCPAVLFYRLGLPLSLISLHYLVPTYSYCSETLSRLGHQSDLYIFHGWTLNAVFMIE